MSSFFASVKVFVTGLMLSGLFFSGPQLVARAEPLTIAVASNFQTSLAAIAPEFEAQTGHEIIIVAGSTGKLAAQIMAGAPFDVFLAADDIAPGKLLAGGHGISGTEFSYALGALALYAPQGGDAKALLLAGDFAHLAIANPALAPYGAAAVETLKALNLYEKITDNLVMGENIAQAFSMAKTGNAELAFIAVSQMPGQAGNFWRVPGELHQPIRQIGMLITDKTASRAFVEYLQSEAVREQIREMGYAVP